MKRHFISHLVESLGIKAAVFRHAVWFLVVGFGIMLGGPARGENLIEVYNLAKEKDPAFMGEFYRHEAAPEALKQAYSELWPSVSGDASYARKREEIKNTDVAVFGQGISRYPTKGYTLTLTQPVLRYSSIMRVVQAKEEVKRADVQFEAAKQDLILRVAEVYMDALEAWDNLAFTQAEEAAVKMHFELARGRYKSGLAPVTDYHDARARLANTTALKVRAENSLDDALEAVAEVAGRPVGKLAKLRVTAPKQGPYVGGKGRGGAEDTGKKGGDDSGERTMPLVSPDPDEAETWIDAALKQNLAVEVQRQSVLVAEREVERQKAGHWPSLNLVGRIYRDDEGGSLFGGESDVLTREVGLELSVPIFQGFSVLSKTREARELLKAAREDLERETRSVKRQTRASFLGVKSAIKNTEAFAQSVVSNRIALEAKREGFKSGLFPSLAVLDAERDLHQARQAHAKAQYEYILNGLRLKKSVGTITEEDLAEINQWLE